MKFGFLIKNPKHGLVYTGDVAQYDKVLDSASAEVWFRKKKGGDFETITLSVYGQQKKVVIPVSHAKDLKGSTIITDEFISFLREKAKQKIYSDISLGYWDELLKTYECIVNEEGWICFHDGKKKDIVLKTIEEKADFVMLREYMGGYVRVDPYIYCEQDKNGKYIETPINLHTTYETGGLGIKIPNNYTVGLRNLMFGDIMERFERKQLLQGRQYDLLEKMGKETYACGSRRMGKTFFCAFVCIREIMRQSFDIRRSGSPIQVLYIANKSSTFTSVINYIKGMCKQMGKDFNNMFWRDTTTMKGSRVLNFGSGLGTDRDVLGRVIFVSAKESDAGLGMSADLVIIDEAGIVPKQVVDNIMPIVTLEGAKLLCISTMYENSLKGWFFNCIMEGEKNLSTFKQETLELYRDEFYGKELKPGDSNKWFHQAVQKFYEKNNIVACRYTIDDVEIYTEAEKEAAKQNTLKRGMVAYLAELYSRFVDTGKAFAYEDAIVEKIDEVAKYEHIVIGYDPASLSDGSGVVVVGFDKIRKKIVVLYADYFTTDTGQYQEQIRQFVQVEDVYKKFLENPSNIYRVIDSTQGGIADVFETSGIYFDRRYRWRSGSEQITESRKIMNEIRMPKDILVKTIQEMFANNYLVIHQKMNKLIAELDTYQQIVHTNGKIEYQGVGNRDDIVSAFMMAVYYMYNDIGVKYLISDYRQDVYQINEQDANAYRNTLLLAEQKIRDAQSEYERVKSLYYSNNVF